MGFKLQRCACLPSGPGDRPVQGLATEAGIIWFVLRDDERAWL